MDNYLSPKLEWNISKQGDIKKLLDMLFDKDYESDFIYEKYLIFFDEYPAEILIKNVKKVSMRRASLRFFVKRTKKSISFETVVDREASTYYPLTIGNKIDNIKEYKNISFVDENLFNIRPKALRLMKYFVVKKEQNINKVKSEHHQQI